MTETVKVDCGMCRRCCKHELITLYPERGDDPSQYLTMTVPDILKPDGEPRLALQQKANGDCIYLGDNGCTIWGRHPQICKKFDCAAAYLSMVDTLPNKSELRLYMKMFGGETLAIGKKRAKEMGLA